MNELVSIVVPIYNVEKHLDKCIKSLTNQKYANLEIILVDDGSPDGCPQICDLWKEKDKRIRVIHKENGGLSDARNAALDICRGKYIIFVDSDDYVEEEYVSYLLELVTRNDASIGICELRMITPEGKTLNSICNNGDVIVLNQEQALREMCERKWFSNSACSKIFAREIFDDVRFPVGRLFEDLATVYVLFMRAEKVVFGRKALYNYVRWQGSIMTSSFQWRKMDAVIYTEKMCTDILEKYPYLHVETSKRALFEYINCYKEIILSRERSQKAKQTLTELQEKIKASGSVTWKNGINVKMRGYVICAYISKHALAALVRIDDFLWKRIKLC